MWRRAATRCADLASRAKEGTGEGGGGKSSASSMLSRLKSGQAWRSNTVDLCATQEKERAGRAY